MLYCADHRDCLLNASEAIVLEGCGLIDWSGIYVHISDAPIGKFTVIVIIY